METSAENIREISKGKGGKGTRQDGDISSSNRKGRQDRNKIETRETVKRQQNANRARRGPRLQGARQKEARWKRRERKENAIKKTNKRQTKDKQPKAKDKMPDKSRYGIVWKKTHKK